MKPKQFFCLLFCLLLFASCARAGTWYCFEADSESIPSELEDGNLLFRETDGDFVMSFLGDCTLGGEARYRKSSRGFVKTIGENYAYPFTNLKQLTETDDLTIANLEGVLSDRDLKKNPKKYNFKGATAYTAILTTGSVECVTLANNHSLDYKRSGYADTVSALDAAGIAYFGNDSLAVYDSESIRIGFIGCGFVLKESYLAQCTDILHDVGCDAIVLVMHCGQEYAESPSSRQKSIAEMAEHYGVNAVIGHHPHIVQGCEIIGSMPVVYSLGNCVFGGNSNPEDHDALCAKVTFSFSHGSLVYTDVALVPISVSSQSGRNDYCPIFLYEEDALRVEKKLEASMKNSLPLLASRCCIRMEAMENSPEQQ